MSPKLCLGNIINLKGLFYYFYHVTTLKHLEDLNMMFLNYFILLLNMGYKILRMEQNCKKFLCSNHLINSELLQTMV
jgi:hypothetical protein